MEALIQTSPRNRLIYGLIAVLLIAAFCLRLPLIRDRYFDPDELQHIQIAYLISRGWVPHKDFFEHHNHLFHLFLLPLFLLDDQIEILFVARIIMQGLVVVVIILTYLLGEKLYSPPVGGLATLWLAFNYIFLVKTIEVRPDTLAMIFLLLASLLSLAAIRRRRNSLWALAGFSFALSFLCTQKAIFPVLGVAVYLAFFRARGGFFARRANRKKLILQAACAAGGFLLPIGVCSLYFLGEEALPNMIRENVLLNLNWQHHFSPLLYLRLIAFFNPYFVFWSVIGLIRAPLISRRRPEQSEEGTSLPYFALLGGVFGAVINPVPYSQYYALLMPLAAVYGALSISWFLSWIWPARLGTKLIAGLLLILPILLPAYITFHCDYRYELRLEDVTFWIIFSGAAMTAAYCASLLAPRRIGKYWSIIALLAAILIRPINLIVHCPAYTNHAYLKYLKTIREATGFDDRVLDGWTGLGVFRFPAYYYAFLHHGILRNLTSEQKGEELLKAIEDSRPAIVVKDDAFHCLAPEIPAYIERNYHIIAEGRLRGVPIQIYRRND